MIKSVRLSSFLSFGSESKEISLQNLNIIIGTNGSGKSNFLEAFDLLRSASSDITKPIRVGGGVSNWLNKGHTPPEAATLDFVIKNPTHNARHDELRYVFSFDSVANQAFEIVDERIESRQPDYNSITTPYIYYAFNHGKPTLNAKTESEQGGIMRTLRREDIDVTQSILVQKRDDFYYPEITSLSQELNKIQVFREWGFGRYTPARMPQKPDLPNKYLEHDCSNLGLVLNQIQQSYATKQLILQELQYFYQDIADYNIFIEGGTVQIFFQESGLNTAVPATRLSDGTLRYLCLLAILCHPAPPPLICIDEPELGLHPDIIPHLAELLRRASEHSQLIVTTHSEALVDCFTETPEVVLVAEKDENGTHLARLNKENLSPWLEKYRLGDLWRRGDIGGNRW